MKQGWERKKLGEVCTFSQGIQVPTESQHFEQEEGMIRFLRIIDFTQKGEAPRFIDNVDDKYILHDNELAIVRYGTPGFVCYGKYGAIANNLFKITPQKGLFDYHFLKFWLESNAFQGVIKGSKYGAALQAIKFSTIYHIPIPVPPLSIQERIVEELDCISGIIEKKKEQLKELDALAQSIFYTMFGDPVENDKGWEVKAIGDFGTVERGAGISKKDFVEEGLPCIHYGQLHTILGPTTRLHHTSIPKSLLPKYKIAHTGDLVMAITSEDVEGSCKSTAWLGNYDIVIGSDAAILHHKQDGTFLSYYTMTNAFYNEKAKYAKGFKVTHISAKEIENIPVYLPPLPLQQEFAKKIEAIEKQKELIRRSIGEVETLLASRMQEYFE